MAEWQTTSFLEHVIQYRQRPIGKLYLERRTEAPLNHLLPTLASDYSNQCYQEPHVFTSIALTLLVGIISDKNSSIKTLRGFENSVLKEICSYLKIPNYLEHVKLTLPGECAGSFRNEVFYQREGTDYVSFAYCGFVNFPPPEDRNVNMMPFILGNESSLPEYLRCYTHCIKQCPIDSTEIGKVCYLTVNESMVKSQTTQRRKGLHIEELDLFPSEISTGFTPGNIPYWGEGVFTPDKFEGGLYFASNVSATNMVYNALIDKNVPGITDKHGNCEHLRKFLGPGTKLEAGQLLWITDRTPHEAREQQEDKYCQFFQVVTSRVTHWNDQYYTPNPLVPFPENVTISDENKLS